MFVSLVKIHGDSMAPALPDTSYALFRRKRRFSVGDIVLVDHPRFGMIVKTITRFTSDNRVGLAGLSLSSTSPAKLGVVPEAAVKGKLLLRHIPRRCRL